MLLAAALVAAQGPLKGALYAVLLLVGYAAFVLARPTRCCPGCRGLKNVRRGRRMVPCERCGRTGRIKRFGAALVHKVFWRVAGEALAEHRKARLRETRARGEA